jgi:Dolichyl-phosphate-mannose-protein mannosyltransferase
MIETETNIAPNLETDNGRSGLIYGFAIIVAMATALILRIPGLTERSFSMDEGYQIYHALLLFETGFANVLRGAIGTTSFDYLFSFIGLQLADGELGARIFALLHGLATVPLIYLLARRIAGRPYALMAALLLACSPAAILYSQTARPYAALAFYQTLTEFFFIRYLQRAKSSDLWAFMISGVITQLVYPLALLQLIGHFIFAVWLTRTPALREALKMKLDVRGMWKAVVVLTVVASALFAVHFLQATDKHFQIPVYGARPFTLDGFLETAGFFSAGTGIGLLPAIGGYLLLLFGFWRKGKKSIALLIALLTVLPYITVAATTTILAHNYGARYLLGYYPIWLIASSAGWIGLLLSIGRKITAVNLVKAVASVLALTLWLGLFSQGLRRYQESTASPTTSIDWRSLSQRLSKYEPHTPLLFDPFHIIPTYLYATFSLLYFREAEKRLDIFSDYDFTHYASTREILPEKFVPLLHSYAELGEFLPLHQPLRFVLPVPNLDFWANREIDRFWEPSDFGGRPEFKTFSICVRSMFEVEYADGEIIIAHTKGALETTDQLGRDLRKLLDCYAAAYNTGDEVGLFVPVFFAARMRRSLEKIGERYLARELLALRYHQIFVPRYMDDIEKMLDLD